MMDFADDLDAESAIFQALAAASMCWSETPNAVFQSVRAEEIGKELLAHLRQLRLTQDTPNLGLATTRELLAEVTTRVEIDYYAGGGGLDYSTVAGRPGGNDGQILIGR